MTTKTAGPLDAPVKFAPKALRFLLNGLKGESWSDPVLARAAKLAVPTNELPAAAKLWNRYGSTAAGVASGFSAGQLDSKTFGFHPVFKDHGVNPEANAWDFMRIPAAGLVGKGLTSAQSIGQMAKNVDIARAGNADTTVGGLKELANAVKVKALFGGAPMVVSGVGSLASKGMTTMDNIENISNKLDTAVQDITGTDAKGKLIRDASGKAKGGVPAVVAGLDGTLKNIGGASKKVGDNFDGANSALKTLSYSAAGIGTLAAAYLAAKGISNYRERKARRKQLELAMAADERAARAEQRQARLDAEEADERAKARKRKAAREGTISMALDDPRTPRSNDLTVNMPLASLPHSQYNNLIKKMRDMSRTDLQTNLPKMLAQHGIEG